MNDVPPVRREVVVELAPLEAFAFFTDHIGDWWPLAELSVFGGAATVAFIDGDIIETFEGQRSVWGSVTEWEPGARVSFTWHPGREVNQASLVSVSFTARLSAQTLVVLEHSGWEVFANPAAARDEYNEGWPMVLKRYGNAAAQPPDARPDTSAAAPGRPEVRATQSSESAHI